MPAPSGSETPKKRSVGRPRDPALEGRIKDAGLRVLAQYGFSGLTLERVCKAAQIPKATFYRRWDTPRHLVSEAFNERFEYGLLHDTGDILADLQLFARVLVELYTDPLLGRCLRFIMAEGAVHPEVAALFRDAQSQRRKHNVGTLEKALKSQGRQPAISPQIILNVLNGVAINMGVAGRTTPPEAFDTIVALVLQPLAEPDRPTER